MKRKNLSNAFRELRRQGYFAKQNFTCCQSCGWSEVPEDKENRAVFYHRQDYQDMIKTGEVYLAWAGNGQEIVKILTDNGLSVTWDGSTETRIIVKI